jgi:predicted dehydrogenase
MHTLKNTLKSEEQELKIACLGAGFFSQFHIDGWKRIENADIVGIADRDMSKAAATGSPAFDSLQKMLEQVKPDILDIILPPVAHADMIRQALRYDLKAIICQKPFCTSLAEAQEMVSLSQEAGIPIIVHENFRFQPWYRAIKAKIDEGYIGTPLQATFRLRPGDGQGKDAYMARQPYFQTMDRFLIHETGVHWIDTFRYLFGDPTAVYADLRRVNAHIVGEDAGYILFDHAQGVRSVFDGNRCLDHAAANTRCTMGEGIFEGTKGSLYLWGNGSVTLRRFGSTTSECVLGPDETGIFGGDCAHHLQQHIIKALNGFGTLENEASEYLKVIQIEEAAYQSAKKMHKINI